MTDVHLLENEQPSSATSYVNELLNKMERILHEHRQKDPDLYRLVDEQRLIKAAKQVAMVEAKPLVAVANACSQKEDPLYFKQYEQKQLKQKIAANQSLIRDEVLATQAIIVPRTKARNAKQPYASVESYPLNKPHLQI
jgi:hypothetical protein